MHDHAPDTAEEFANSGCHGIALLAACLATPKLLESALHAGDRAYAGVVIFSTTMVMLYGASTAYHALPRGKAKQWLLKLDHAAIYLFIAGSFTPFALSQPASTQNMLTLSLVWGAAVAGFVMKALVRNTSTLWSTGLYVAMGWLVLIAALPLIKPMPALGTAWLVIGGAAYTVGVVFYALDSTVRFAHAVWHACVAAGTTCHVFAVLSVMTHTAA
jgi:hemolysin III